MNLLDVQDLSSRYGHARILHSVSLAVGAGETVVLLGRNGAGKSTLLKSIAGLVRARQGRVHFDGADISFALPYQICRLGLGYVPEERRIFANLTVRENLEVGRRAGQKAGRWPLERIFEVFPNLALLLDRMGGAMSGGEQQMLTIARTLMGNPEMILLDEPSEGLAPVILEQMVTMIRILQTDGLSILLSEQNMHFATLIAERAYILDRGIVRHEGRMRDIAADEALSAQYLAVRTLTA